MTYALKVYNAATGHVEVVLVGASEPVADALKRILAQDHSTDNVYYVTQVP